MDENRAGRTPGTRAFLAALLLAGLLAAARATVLGPPITHLTKRIYLAWLAAFCLSAFAALLFRGRVVPRLFALCLAAGVAEGASGVAYRLIHGEWHHRTLYRQTPLFERHPYLVGVPRPGLRYDAGTLHVTHTPGRWRGPGVGSPGATIAAIGGSSTYCVRLSDDDAWPAQLDRLLGPSNPVVNLGVPGYSTVEHVVQTAFLLPEISPRIALYYIGWNDARNTGIRGLRPDYGEYHGWSQSRTLGLTSEVVRGSRYLAFFTLVLEALDRADVLDVNPPRTVKAEGDVVDGGRPDPRAIELYRRNLRSLVALCRQQGIVPVFVPQVMNRARLTGTGRYGWLPFVRDRDVPALVEAYDAALSAVSRELDVAVLEELTRAAWTPDDFLDQGHFSARGARRFAWIVADALRSRGLVRS